MKPFYRVLTYMVLIIQSFIILTLLVDKRQPEYSYTGTAKAKADCFQISQPAGEWTVIHKKYVSDLRAEIVNGKGNLLHQ